MKAINVLRGFLSESPSGVYPYEVLGFVDAIERELEERYIEGPVDADNVPIKVNDEMESVHRPEEVFIVKRLKYSEKHGWMIGGAARDDLSEYGLYAPFNCHHHKPPTVEDVLEEYRVKYYDLVTDMECKNITNEEYVQGIRELASEFAKRLQLREED